MAPTIMGNADRPELGEELTNSFCRTDPEIAKQFARVTFTSDNREDLARVTVRTLIPQWRLQVRCMGRRNNSQEYRTRRHLSSLDHPQSR
jgi:hypothetical protein